MSCRFAAGFVLGLGAAATAEAQIAPTPTPPPLSAPVAPAPVSPLSPILTNPGLALEPYRPGGSTLAPQPASPLNQQQLQSYRNDLNSRQRALDRQGVSPGSEQYRENQQQLNQLNSVR